jgi:tetratricopeptide (TPR) repeat protein
VVAAVSWWERRVRPGADPRSAAWLATVAGLFVAAPAIAGAAGVKNPALLLTASVLGAGAGVVCKPFIDGYQRSKERAHGAALEFRSGCLTDGRGRPPIVRHLADPTLLGVHPARLSGSGAGGYQASASASAAASGSVPASTSGLTGAEAALSESMPAYVPRDVDPWLRERIASGGFVLIVGDSTAGKTRTAYEAMAATLQGHALIAPKGRDALPGALAMLEHCDAWVLWLDDLTQFVGSAGLNRTTLGRLLSSPGHHVILATIGAGEHARYTDTAYYSEADETARGLFKEARGVIEQAFIVRLPRMFSSAEHERASVRSWDPRIADAVAHSARYGIAEYLAAGPELLEIWRDAWSPDPGPGSHPRGAALVAAAVDCKRAGLDRPIPRALVTELHGLFLAARGGALLQPEPLEQAWQWATTPRRTTTRLLFPRDDAATTDTQSGMVEAFDYLVEAFEPADGMPEQVRAQTLTAVLAVANEDECGRVGNVAHLSGRYEIALSAYAQATARWLQLQGECGADVLTSRSNHALVLHDLGRLGEAEAEHRSVAAARERTLGPGAAETLTSRSNHALVLHELGRLDEAEAEHRAVVEARIRHLGARNPNTLNARHNLARVHHDQGRLAETEAEYRAVLADRIEVHGPDHPNTLNTRSCLARVLYDLGRFQEAEQEHLIELRTRIRLLASGRSRGGRAGFTRMLQDLGRLYDAELEHRAEPVSADALSLRDHPEFFPRILHAPENFADAEREHGEELAICVHVLGSDHPNTLTSRGNHARLLHAMGRLEEARDEHAVVLAARRQVLGVDHPVTLISQNNLALVLHDLGELREAAAAHRAKLETCARTLGPEHPNTLTSRANLAAVAYALGEIDEAQSEHRAVFETRRRVLGAEHPHTLTSRSNLATVLYAMGRPAEAATEHRAVLEARLRLMGAKSPYVLNSRSSLAAVLRAQGRVAEAVEQYGALYAALCEQFGPEHAEVVAVRSAMDSLAGERDADTDTVTDAAR